MDTSAQGVEEALQRLYAAPDITHAEIEVINALAHLYRLRERLKAKVGGDEPLRELLGEEPHQVVSGIIWARNGETHELITLSEMGDVFPDRFTAMFGIPCWQPPPEIGHPVPREHYLRHLAGRPVAETIREALDVLTKLVRDRL